MLPLLSFLLAISSGQPSPKLSDPPPCAAVNVRGCLPGYKALHDRRGRLIYVRDPDYIPPLAQGAPAPLTAVPSQGTVVQQLPSGPFANSPELSPARQPQADSEDRGHVALVFTPAVSTFPSFSNFDNAKPEGRIALELRGTHGGSRVRFAGQYSSFGKIGEIAFKYDFFDETFFRPFLAVGLGIASINPDPEVRAAGSASAGVDLFLSSDFFLTGEFQRRLFMSGTQGAAHGLEVSNQKQTSLLVGMGIYFF
jgi:hypothetical protein